MVQKGQPKPEDGAKATSDHTVVTLYPETKIEEQAGSPVRTRPPPPTNNKFLSGVRVMIHIYALFFGFWAFGSVLVGVPLYLLIVITLLDANVILQREIKFAIHGEVNNGGALFWIVVLLLVENGLMYGLNFGIHRALIFQLTDLKPVKPLNFYMVVLIVVAAADFLAYSFALASKALVLAISNDVVPLYRKRSIYHFLEESFQLYRSLLPFPHWTIYLISLDEEDGKYFAGMYLGYKLVDTSLRFWFNWISALKALFQKFPKGLAVVASEEEVESLKSQSTCCRVCEGPFTKPYRIRMLCCGVVFLCKKCAIAWFTHQLLCPACKRRVIDWPRLQYRDGDTVECLQIL